MRFGLTGLAVVSLLIVQPFYMPPSLFGPFFYSMLLERAALTWFGVGNGSLRTPFRRNPSAGPC